MTAFIPVASGSIFISYRREETAFAAGWLFDRLVAHFGKDQVFKDVDSIQLGDDFADVISAAVGNCDVLLALIGDRWLTITGEDGQRRRLDDLHDFVRLEIETALIRDIRVIPVLIEGVRMPHAAELPPSLANLERRHGLELSASRFDNDTGRLIVALNRILTEEQAQQAADDAGSLVKISSDKLRVPFDLTPDEKQVIVFRKHLAVLIVPIFIILGAVAVASTPVNVIRLQSRNGLEITWILLALFLTWALWRIIAWIRNYFIITSRRMLLVSGILRLRAETISFAKVTDISYRIPMLGRIFGYGEIIFERAGTSADLQTVYQVPYPEQIFLELAGLIFPNIDDPSGS